MKQNVCFVCLFRFYTETDIFDVSIEPKQTEDQPKQFDMEHIIFLYIFLNILFRLFRFYTETESFDVLIELKQTEDQPKQLIESIFWYFYENLELFQFVSKQFCLFQLFRYRFETLKQTKTNRNILFFVS
jgi:hypothetical protein